MASTLLQVPVHIPSMNKDWEVAQGLATITDDGEIHIKLVNKGAAEWLITLAKEKLLVQCSFDYRMTPAMVEAINNRYKE